MACHHPSFSLSLSNSLSIFVVEFQRVVCCQLSGNMPTTGRRRFVFTCNSDVDAQTIADRLLVVPQVKQFGVANETAPTTGRHHVQGFVVFLSNFRPAAVKDVLAEPTAHIEVMRGSVTQNVEYISKEDEPILHGCEAKMSEIAEAVQLAQKHGTKRVAEDLPVAFVRHHRGLQALEMYNIGAYVGERFNVWLYGMAGSGKSFIARRVAQLLGKEVYTKVQFYINQGGIFLHQL